jgi:hypothetical protein
VKLPPCRICGLDVETARVSFDVTGQKLLLGGLAMPGALDSLKVQMAAVTLVQAELRIGGKEYEDLHVEPLHTGLSQPPSSNERIDLDVCSSCCLLALDAERRLGGARGVPYGLYGRNLYAGPFRVPVTILKVVLREQPKWLGLTLELRVPHNADPAAVRFFAADVEVPIVTVSTWE